MVIMGVAAWSSQLSQARLIDVYQLVVNPVVLGSGRTLFDGKMEKLQLKLSDLRGFKMGISF